MAGKAVGAGVGELRHAAVPPGERGLVRVLVAGEAVELLEAVGAAVTRVAGDRRRVGAERVLRPGANGEEGFVCRCIKRGVPRRRAIRPRAAGGREGQQSDRKRPDQEPHSSRPSLFLSLFGSASLIRGQGLPCLLLQREPEAPSKGARPRLLSAEGTCADQVNFCRSSANADFPLQGSSESRVRLLRHGSPQRFERLWISASNCGAAARTVRRGPVSLKKTLPPGPSAIAPSNPNRCFAVVGPPGIPDA